MLSGAVSGGSFSGIGAGGLVGQNGLLNLEGPPRRGTIVASDATVNVTVGNSTAGNQANYAGGLVGVNPGSINGSFASGTVSGGFTSFVGGLVGQNYFGGSITNSGASGAVSGATGQNSPFGSGVGGLVGFNSGLISGSFATGAVSGTTETTNQPFAVILGGLVGLNSDPGQIVNSYATGSVTALNSSVEIGGLVGGNSAPITNSYATGAVTGSGSGTIGGLVGLSFASTITGSHATGAVSGTGSVSVGGFIGENQSGATITNSYATGAITASASGAVDFRAGGFAGENSGGITGSYATGSVTSNGGDATAGGFIGDGGNGGVVSFSFATGSVTVNGAVNALAGGLMGTNVGNIDHSYATGDVTINATNAIGGGLLGINNGTIDQAFATGNVKSTSTNSLLGGFVGLNANGGAIIHAYAVGAVTGGANDVVGGFAGGNIGTLDQTYAIGKITGGGLVGGLVAANASGPLGPAASNPDFAPFLTGTGTTTNSYWDTQTTGVNNSAGGTGLTTRQLIAALPPGFDHSVWTIQPDPSYPYFPWQTNNIPFTNEPPPILPSISSQQPQIIDNLISTVTFAALNTSPVFNNQNGGARQPTFPPPQPPGPPPGAGQPGQPSPPGGQPGGQPGAGQQPLPGLLQRIIDIPALTETRFVVDQVLVQARCDTAVPRVEEAVRGLGLSLLATQDLCSTAGSIALQFRITNGEDVRAIVRRLASVQIVAIAQPNFIYVTLQEPAADPAAPASRGTPEQQQGDAAQYILQKLQINDVHRLVRGTNVPIAVIDSEIDASHPDLQGVIVQRFSAAGAGEAAPARHRHGRRHRLAPAADGDRAVVAALCRARLLDQGGKRGEHHLQHPQGSRLGAEPERPHH